MPRKLNNPAARHVNVNYSIDSRANDCLIEEAEGKQVTKSSIVNFILKKHYNITD